MAARTEKQRRQQELYLALGTISGFKGYMNNFQHAVNIVARDHYDSKQVAYHLAEIYYLIGKLDTVARIKMNNL